jgi:hypothetical protein
VSSCDMSLLIGSYSPRRMPPLHTARVAKACKHKQQQFKQVGHIDWPQPWLHTVLLLILRPYMYILREWRMLANKSSSSSSSCRG